MTPIAVPDPAAALPSALIGGRGPDVYEASACAAEGIAVVLTEAEIFLPADGPPNEYTQAVAGAIRSTDGTDVLWAMKVGAEAAVGSQYVPAVTVTDGARNQSEPGSGPKKRFTVLAAQRAAPGSAHDMNALERALGAGKARTNEVVRIDGCNAERLLATASGLVEATKRGDDIAVFFSGRAPSGEGLLMDDGSRVAQVELDRLVQRARERGVNFGLSIDARRAQLGSA